MSTTVNYKGATIATADNETKTLTTAGTWLEDDIEIVDVKSLPTGTINITENGTVDVSDYASASVAVLDKALVVDTPDPLGGVIRDITTKDIVRLEAQKSVTLTHSDQTITPSVGYDGFESVLVSSEQREDLTVPKDVDFIDFDGRLVYSYTTQEFLALESMPTNPTYSGLVPQGWNWSLEDAQEYVAQYGALVIGQNYTTYDGKTRIYIDVPQDYIDDGKYVKLYFGANVTFTVDWGDGSAISSCSATTTSDNHYYQNPGEYTITIDMSTANAMFGANNSWNGIFPDDHRMMYLAKRIEIGNNITSLGRQPFRMCRNLKSISIPTSLISMSQTTSDGSVFMTDIKGVVFPNGMTGKAVTLFGDGATNPQLRYVSVPKTMTLFHMSTYPRFLRKLTLPPLTSTGTCPVKLYDTYLTTHFIVVGAFTSFNDDTCRNARIKVLFIPESIGSLGGTMFAFNRVLEEVHLLRETPPTLSSTSAFRDSPSTCVFYVPYSDDHSILDAYKTATNWSTYASQMQEEPQS